MTFLAAWASMVATSADAIENVLLLSMLWRHREVGGDREVRDHRSRVPVALLSIGFDLMSCRFGCG